MENVLYLRKTRDFGERLSDSINFVKFNWKNLGILYLIFVAPLLLVATLLGASSFSAFFSKVGILATDSSFLGEILNTQFFAAIFLYILAVAAYATVVNLYIRLYEANNGHAPTIAEIGGIFFKKLLSNLLYAVLATLMFMGLLMVMIIPILGWLVAFVGAFYLLVNLSILFSVNTIEDNPVPQSISRSFFLIRDNWWSTFGYWIVLGMIYYFISMVISLVVNLVFGFASINFLTQPDTSVYTEKYFLVNGLTASCSVIS